MHSGRGLKKLERSCVFASVNLWNDTAPLLFLLFIRVLDESRVE